MAPIEVEVPEDLGLLYYPPSLRKQYGMSPFSYDPDQQATGPPAVIGWQPDQAQYEARLTEEAADNTPRRQLPAGWPQHLTSPLAWKGEDFTDSDQYIVRVDKAHLDEIANAVSNVKKRGTSPSDINKETFPLPTLGPILASLSSEVHNGRGFFILRGLRPEMWNDEENLIVYLGVSSYVAERRARLNTYGDMVSHILAAPPQLQADAEWQPIFSTSAQPFHSDVGADILSFYAISAAESGGDHLLASSWTVYNQMYQTRPDLLAELAAGDWVHNTYGHYPPFYNRPLLFQNDGKPILNFSRRVITGNTGYPRDSRAPPITLAQANALDTVQFTAQPFQLRIPNVAGDMMFINNFGILHSRDAFQDSAAAQRHLLRLWLRNDDLGWNIPDGLRLEWDNLYQPAPELPPLWNKTAKFRNDGTSSHCG